MSAISSIYRRGQRADPAPVDEARFAAACHDLWHERGHVVVKADELRQMPAGARLTLEALAIGKWGKRGAQKHG